MAALKRTTWLVVAALAVIVLVFVLVHHRQEPEAMGKPLSYWAVRREIGDQTAVRALREIGSNASPELRRMLRTEVSFPSIPIAQAIDFYENISGTRIAPPPNGWPPSTTLSIKTHDSVTKSEAEQLIEKCLKQQAKIEIKTRADGTLVAVPIK